MKDIINSMNEIGTVIKTHRKDQGLSQEDLAGISGTGRRFISDLENGKENIQTGKLLQVINALGLTISIGNEWRPS